MSVREPESPRLTISQKIVVIHSGSLKQSTNKTVVSAYYVQASIIKQYGTYEKVKLLVLALLRFPM